MEKITPNRNEKKSREMRQHKNFNNNLHLHAKHKTRKKESLNRENQELFKKTLFVLSKKNKRSEEKKAYAVEFCRGQEYERANCDADDDDDEIEKACYFVRFNMCKWRISMHITLLMRDKMR